MNEDLIYLGGIESIERDKMSTYPEEFKALEEENKKLQKQSDLLTLGLLQEKNKVTRLRKALEYINVNKDCPAVQCEGDWQTGMFCGLEDRAIVDRYDACLYGYNMAIERINEWVLCGINEALEEQRSLGAEMADAFDKIVETGK